MILALDLSSSTGWAAGVPGGRPVFGVWHLPKIGSAGAQGAALSAALADSITVHKPALVIMESPLVLSAQTAQASCYQQFGLAYLTETVCDLRSVRVRQESPATVRKATIGRGRGVSKEDVLAWCRKQGWAVTDHNAGDALALWRYACMMPMARAA